MSAQQPAAQQLFAQQSTSQAGPNYPFASSVGAPVGSGQRPVEQQSPKLFSDLLGGLGSMDMTRRVSPAAAPVAAAAPNSGGASGDAVADFEKSFPMDPFA